MQDQDDSQEAEFVDEDEAENSLASVKKLREKLTACVKEKQEYLDGWQRLRAEFANYKKQESTFSKEKEFRMKAELVEKLLPAFDVVELSVRHDKQGDPTLKMLERQFLQSLKSMDVEQFGAEGEAFDPRFYEILEETSTTDEKLNHTVASVHRSGYRIGETVIRPAQVSVFSFKE